LKERVRQLPAQRGELAPTCPGQPFGFHEFRDRFKKLQNGGGLNGK
jgi:hypothetical protein